MSDLTIFEYKVFCEFVERHNREFRYLGKNDKCRAFPENEEQTSSRYVRVAVEMLK